MIILKKNLGLTSSPYWNNQRNDKRSKRKKTELPEPIGKIKKYVVTPSKSWGLTTSPVQIQSEVTPPTVPPALQIVTPSITPSKGQIIPFPTPVLSPLPSNSEVVRRRKIGRGLETKPSIPKPPESNPEDTIPSPSGSSLPEQKAPTQIIYQTIYMQPENSWPNFKGLRISPRYFRSILSRFHGRNRELYELLSFNFKSRFNNKEIWKLIDALKKNPDATINITINETPSAQPIIPDVKQGLETKEAIPISISTFAPQIAKLETKESIPPQSAVSNPPPYSYTPPSSDMSYGPPVTQSEGDFYADKDDLTSQDESNQTPAKSLEDTNVITEIAQYKLESYNSSDFSSSNGLSGVLDLVKSVITGAWIGSGVSLPTGYPYKSVSAPTSAKKAAKETRESQALLIGRELESLQINDITKIRSIDSLVSNFKTVNPNYNQAATIAYEAGRKAGIKGYIDDAGADFYSISYQLGYIDGRDGISDRVVANKIKVPTDSEIKARSDYNFSREKHNAIQYNGFWKDFFTGSSSDLKKYLILAGILGGGILAYKMLSKD